MRRLALGLMAIPLLLSGCLNAYHGKYACQGYPEGVKCKSVREVYSLTNYRESLTGQENDEAGDLPGVRLTAAGGDAGAVQGMGYRGPLPLRTPARIIRIWVAPWESQDGKLHLPTYIYAEVQQRQWSIGEGRLQVAPQITPLETVAPPEKGRDQGQAGPPRQARRPAGQPRGSEKPLFPDQLQRPGGGNQRDLQRLQQMPGRGRPAAGTSTTEGGNTGE